MYIRAEAPRTTAERAVRRVAALPAGAGHDHGYGHEEGDGDGDGR